MRNREQRDARRILADELYWAIKQDKDLCEEILDEYTYLLSDSRVDELTETLEKNFLDDDDTHFIVK
jgi:hypothetical protein